MILQPINESNYVKPSFFIAIWLLTNVFAVGLYDIFAFFFLEAEETVSFWFSTWFRSFPILALLTGIVIGHLAWPLKVASLKEVTKFQP